MLMLTRLNVVDALDARGTVRGLIILPLSARHLLDVIVLRCTGAASSLPLPLVWLCCQVRAGPPRFAMPWLPGRAARGRTPLTCENQ